MVQALSEQKPDVELAWDLWRKLCGQCDWGIWRVNKRKHNLRCLRTKGALVMMWGGGQVISESFAYTRLKWGVHLKCLANE